MTMDCNVIYILPTAFQAKPGQKQEIEGDVCEGEDSGATAAVKNVEPEEELKKRTFRKPEKVMTRHLKPLYIQVLMDGSPVKRVDSGAAVNIMPLHTMRKLGKTADDLVHT